MKSRYRKKPRQPKLPLFYAIITAAAVSAFFYYGFRVSTEHLPPPSNARQEPAPVMIASDSPHDEYARHILAWSLIGDPTIISRPDLELGLSLRHGPVPPLPFSEPPLLTVSIPETEITTAATSVFEPPSQTIRLPAMDKDWPIMIPRPERLPQHPLPRQLIWRLNGERIIVGPPQIDIETVREKAGEEAPEHPTAIEITTLGSDNPRFIIRQSCGNRELDQLALRSLKNFFLTRRPDSSDAQASTGKGNGVLRRPEPGSGYQMEIEWRLVLP